MKPIVDPWFEDLRQIATMAATCPASRAGLACLAGALRDQLGAEQVCFVYAEELDWVTCGDSSGEDDVGTGKTGLWLIQQQAQMQGTPVAFNIESRRVGDFVRAAGAQGKDYLAMRIPVSDSPAEMVIVRGPWKAHVDRALVRFLDAARAPLVVFLERMLYAARVEREREQMAALANPADVLTQAVDAKDVLANIAAAMSSVTGFELVTIALWDQASQTLGPRVMNKLLRWEDTSVSRVWTDRSDSRFDEIFLDVIRSRQTEPSPDLQNNERASPEMMEFFKRIMVVSGASVPVVFGGEVLGAISFAGYRPHTFPPEEMRLLDEMAARLAVGLKAMHMYRALAESKEQLERYSQQLQARTEIQHRLARTDTLTGIPNRRFIEEVIEAEHARALRHRSRFSVGLLDVDRLKAVNDAHGHDAGDEVLIQLARLARRSCRRGDIVGRYGGDEFLFVLPEADLEAAWEFGERFRGKVERQPFRLPQGDTLGLSVSLGMAAAGSGGAQAAPGLIATADAALYRAKSGGGNLVCAQPAAASVA
ncbi:MAG: sensor domain-containing diguanylate cyclase [Dehalococcoidia bacterium]